MAKIVSAKDLSGSQAATFLAASSKEAQQQFFQLVGLCEPVHAMQETATVLTHEDDGNSSATRAKRSHYLYGI